MCLGLFKGDSSTPSPQLRKWVCGVVCKKWGGSLPKKGRFSWWCSPFHPPKTRKTPLEKMGNLPKVAGFPCGFPLFDQPKNREKTRASPREACLQQARRLLELSPKGLRLTKWLLNSPELSLSAALERDARRRIESEKRTTNNEPSEKRVGARSAGPEFRGSGLSSTCWVCTILVVNKMFGLSFFDHFRLK